MESVERIVTIVLISAALMPVAGIALRRQRWSIKLVTQAAILGAVTASVWTLESLRPAAVVEANVVDRPIESPSDGYVTSESCRSCHPRYHATWDGSYHSKMTQVASEESVVGDFRNVSLQHRGNTYLLTQDGDEFFVDVTRSDGRTARRRIVMTTGSHHRQWVWMDTGDSRKIEPFPFLYLIPKQRWIPLESSFLVPPDIDLGFAKGAWNTNCIQCHTTQGRQRVHKLTKRSTSMDTRVGEFGIACESCHGPAEQHIKANRDPLRRLSLRRNDEPDPTMVNPARLEAELSAHVCGQCHAALTLYKSKDLGTYNRWNNSGFAYRPGSDLKNSRYLVGHEPHMQTAMLREVVRQQPDYIPNRFWSDGIIRVAGREFSGLIKTPCYTHGDKDKQMSCLSCHAMHQPLTDERDFKAWADDQMKPDMLGNHACTQCHESMASEDQLKAHTHHAPTSSGSLCYNCHMPHTTFGLLKAIRSHGLVSPSVQSSLATGRPNACNQCHLDRTLDWAGEHLEAWYGQPRPTLSMDEKQIAASVLWALKGDAGQRGLMAWSMGWKDAQEASGTDWITPYLIELLTDPYDAVRFVAYESLMELKASPVHEQLAEIAYDFLAPSLERRQATARMREAWDQRAAAELSDRSTVLFDDNGRLRDREVTRLLKQRDHTPINLQE